MQHAIELVFRKMTELEGTASFLMWFREENVSCRPFLAIVSTPDGLEINGLITVSSSFPPTPSTRGLCLLCKTETRTRYRERPCAKTIGHHKQRHAWMVLIRDHHLGYVSWEEYERNQAMIAANSFMHSGMEPKSGRGGRALLSGILRCRRCGTEPLHVNYSGLRGAVLRYECHATHILGGAFRSWLSALTRQWRMRCWARSAETRLRRHSKL